MAGQTVDGQMVRSVATNSRNRNYVIRALHDSPTVGLRWTANKENQHFYAQALVLEPNKSLVLAKLRRLEPDFMIERPLKDKSYPASLIHKAPNQNLERISSLI